MQSYSLEDHFMGIAVIILAIGIAIAFFILGFWFLFLLLELIGMEFNLPKDQGIKVKDKLPNCKNCQTKINQEDLFCFNCGRANLIPLSGDQVKN